MGGYWHSPPIRQRKLLLNQTCRYAHHHNYPTKHHIIQPHIGSTFLHKHENQYTFIICIHNHKTPPSNQHLTNTLPINIVDTYNFLIKTNHLQGTPSKIQIQSFKNMASHPKTHHHSNQSHHTNLYPKNYIILTPLSLTHNNA